MPYKLRSALVPVLLIAAALLPQELGAQTCTISQITDSTAGDSSIPRLDGGSIAFQSTADLDPGVGNADGNQEIFLVDGSSTSQITDSTVGDSFGPSLDGGSIAFASSADLDPSVSNADGNFEIFLADCAGPSVLEIPTLGGWGLWLLALAVAGLGLRRLIAS